MASICCVSHKVFYCLFTFTLYSLLGLAVISTKQNHTEVKSTVLKPKVRFDAFHHFITVLSYALRSCPQLFI